MINHIFFLTRTYLYELGISPEKGQGLTEYAIIILLVALVVIGALGLLGDQLQNAYETITEAIPVD